MHRSLLPAVLSLSVLLSPHVNAPAPSYTFTTITVPGSTSTAVNANSPNAIAGQFGDADRNTWLCVEPRRLHPD